MVWFFSPGKLQTAEDDCGNIVKEEGQFPLFSFHHDFKLINKLPSNEL